MSGRTPETRYLRIYGALTQRYPDWEQVLQARRDELTIILKPLGLGLRKAAFLQDMLSAIRNSFGVVTLDPLKGLDDDAAEQFLTGLPGIGLKSARCVLMYSLGRQVFPVDTHVWRILKRVGLEEGGRVPSDKAARHLQESVPPRLRYSLHVNLLALGRDVCRSTAPRCSGCPISSLCTYGQVTYHPSDH